MSICVTFHVCVGCDDMTKPYASYLASEYVQPSAYAALHAVPKRGKVDSLFVDGVSCNRDSYRNPIEWTTVDNLLKVVKPFPHTRALLNSFPHDTPVALYWS